MMSHSWQQVGKIKPTELTETRLQLHYAIQFIAAVGSALAEPKPDYSHTSLEWHPELNLFVGEIIQTEKPFQVALDSVNLISIILDAKGHQLTTLPLNQKTLEEGLGWLQGEISQLGADAEKVTFLSYPPDDFPDHEIAHGAAFDASQISGRKELTYYYANNYLLLQEIVTSAEGTSPIHTWPHHFDMATLISLPGTKNGEPMSIGIGLSPGDKTYDEPYWYVSPYPYPNIDSLPELAGGGFWHTEHWVGGVLKASQLSDSKTAETQQSQVKAFLDSALQASQVLLGT